MAFALTHRLSAIKVPSLRFHPAAAAPSQILRIPLRRRLVPAIRATFNTGPSKYSHSEYARQMILYGIRVISKMRAKISEAVNGTTDIASQPLLVIYSVQFPTFIDTVYSPLLHDLYKLCPEIQAENLRKCVKNLKIIRSTFMMPWLVQGMEELYPCPEDEKESSPEDEEESSPEVEKEYRKKDLISILNATDAALAEMQVHLHEAAKKV